jgi:hypothetical protein
VAELVLLEMHGWPDTKTAPECNRCCTAGRLVEMETWPHSNFTPEHNSVLDCFFLDSNLSADLDLLSVVQDQLEDKSSVGLKNTPVLL